MLPTMTKEELELFERTGGFTKGEAYDIDLIVCKLQLQGLLDKAREVALEHNSSVNYMVSKSRLRRHVCARHHFMAYLVLDLGWSLPEVGELLGMDHTSVRSAVARWRENNEVYLETISRSKKEKI